MAKIILFCAVFALLVVASPLLGTGADYVYTYRPPARLWIEGQTGLYDGRSPGLYNPPWLIWLLTPLAALPVDFGLRFLRAASAVIMLYSLDRVTTGLGGYPRLFALIGGSFNMIVFDLLNRGQIDALALLGAILCLPPGRHWLVSGIGYSLLAIKPPNTIPLMIYLLVRDFRHKPLKTAAAGLLVPGGVGLLSLLLHGWWPARLLDSLRATPPYDTWRTTIWRAAEVLQLPLVLPVLMCLACLVATAWLWLRARNQEQRVTLLVLATFIITPYALSYHYILALVLALPFLLNWRLWIGLVLYGLTFSSLLRILTGPEHAYIDLVFIFAAFLATAAWLLDQRSAFPQQSPAGYLVTTAGKAEKSG